MNKSYSKILLWFDRMLSKSLWKQFAFLGIALIVLLGLSYLLISWSGADWQNFCDSKGLNKWLLPIYLLIDSSALSNLYFGNVNGWMLIVSSLTFLVGLFVFNGIIISIITNSISQRVADYKEGHIHYLKSGHYIIMGYDDMIPSIISYIFEKDKDALILLMSSAGSDRIREKLRKTFSENQLERIIINYGHRTSKDYYNDIRLESANQVFIVGLRTSPSHSHDAINVECVDSICTYLEQPCVKNRPKRITCVFEDLDTYAAFKTSEIFDRVKNLGIAFVPYNFYADWAKQVFVNQFHKDNDHPDKKIPYPSVYGNRIAIDDTKYVHLVFVGTTNFAVAFAMEAAHVLHFPNGEKVKTLITFIDKNADTEKDEFIIRNRHFFEVQAYYYCDLSQGSSYQSKEDYRRRDSVYFSLRNGYTNKDANFLDVEFEFIKGDVFSNEVQNTICKWANEHNKKQYLSIFLAMADQHKNFVMGMNMPDAVYDKEVPVFIRQDRSDNFVSNLRETDQAILNNKKKNTYYVMEGADLKKFQRGGRYAHIYPFGMTETAFSSDVKSLARAKLVNYLYSTMQDNKFQSLLALNTMSDKQLWAEANEYWNSLNVALKWSNLYNAYTLNIKLAILRSLRNLPQDDNSQDTWPINDTEAEILAQVEHNRWNVEKLLMGYRKPHKDEDKYRHKEFEDDLKNNKNRYIHHDIRPYDDLDNIKKLDAEFARYIPWIIKMTDGKPCEE